jgi:hypothetical protein
VPDQHVSAVYGLELVAPYLEQWCSSYNDLTSLDFSNFVKLDTIECYLSSNLSSVNLTNTPALRRACFEDCNLASLDLSQSPNLEDIRGALNAYRSIQFGTTGANAWHICVRDNPQISNPTLFANTSQFPNIAELLIWNDNQSGTLDIPSTHPSLPISLIGDDNQYSMLDFSGAFKNRAAAGIVSFQNNRLTQVNIAGCAQITELYLNNNLLGASQLDALLETLDSLGRSRDNTPSEVSLTVDLRQNDNPSATGYTHASALAQKGWTVYAEAWTLTPTAQ